MREYYVCEKCGQVASPQDDDNKNNPDFIFIFCPTCFSDKYFIKRETNEADNCQD